MDPTRASVLLVLLGTVCSANAQSAPLEQLKTEFQEIERRICADPKPKKEQLEQLQACSPLLQVAGKELIDKCEQDAFTGEKDKEVILQKYCSATTEVKADLDKKMYACVMEAAKNSPSEKFKELMQKAKEWREMDEKAKKEHESKQMEELEKKMKEILACEKKALDIK